jgi:hypothetical protein
MTLGKFSLLAQKTREEWGTLWSSGKKPGKKEKCSRGVGCTGES